MPPSFISARPRAISRSNVSAIRISMSRSMSLRDCYRPERSSALESPEVQFFSMTARDPHALTHARTQRCRYRPRVYENVNPDPEGATGARYTSRAIRPPLFHIASNFPPPRYRFLFTSVASVAFAFALASFRAGFATPTHDDRSCLTNYRDADHSSG